MEGRPRGHWRVPRDDSPSVASSRLGDTSFFPRKSYQADELREDKPYHSLKYVKP